MRWVDLEQEKENVNTANSARRLEGKWRRKRCFSGSLAATMAATTSCTEMVDRKGAVRREMIAVEK